MHLFRLWLRKYILELSLVGGQMVSQNFTLASIAKEDVWEGGVPINEIAKQIWSFLAEEGSVLIFHNSRGNLQSVRLQPHCSKLPRL